MEDPVFYQAYPAEQKISPRQQQLLLKKIIRFEREAQRLDLHAKELSQQFRRVGVAAPDFSACPLKRWGSLLRGLEHFFSKKAVSK